MELPQKPNVFICNKCDFSSSNKKDYKRHLLTRKHKNQQKSTFDNKLPNTCEFCNKQYKDRSGLWRHKKICAELLIAREAIVPVPLGNQHLSDDQIDKMAKELEEERKLRGKMEEQLLDQKTMFNTMLDKYFKESQQSTNELFKETQQSTREIVKGNRQNTQDLINKFIELAPKMGNTITNNDNRQIVTFNYYLENNCKDAETIHDFIHRYAIKCGDFFRNNATAIINGEASLSFNAHKLFFESLRENPQHMNFVQTSNVHDGIHYVKEREHGEGDDYLTLYGEAEFNKYTDKFRSKGAEISVAVCQVLNKVREEIYNQRKRYCRPEPTESDYSGEYASYATQFTEDMEEYHRQYDNSVEYNSDLSHVLTRQVFSVLNLFDMDRTEGKATCKEILQASRRVR